MTRSLRRILLPLLCVAILAGGTLAQLAVTARPASAAVVTTFTVSSNDANSSYGDTIFLTVAMTGTGVGPTGTVDVRDNATTLCDDVPLNRAGNAAAAECVVPDFAVGTHPITATYNGSSNYDPAESTDSNPALQQVVSQAATETAISSGANPSVFSEPVVFTASVTSSGGEPSGTVTFRADTTIIPTCEAEPATAGVASCTATALGTGDSSITAEYSGDANFAASGSEPLTQTANPAETSVALTSDPAPSTWGDDVTFTAAVTADAPASANLDASDGTVNFELDGDPIVGCTDVPMTASGAECTTDIAPVGTPSVTATFSGDDNFSSSVSAPLGQTVGQAGSTTVITTSGNPMTYGAPFTITATVTGSTGAATGTVAFGINGDPIATCVAATVTSGVATCTTANLHVGVDQPITAQYSGDVNTSGSDALSFNQTVEPASTTTAVTSSDATSVNTQPVTFTATISPVSPAALAPTSGAVSFTLAGDPIAGCATRPVTAGAATCSPDALPLGDSSIVAVFTPADDFLTSTSPPFTQTVGWAATTTAVTSSGSTSTWNDSVTYTATVSPVTPAVGAPSGGTVNFTANTAPIVGCSAVPMSAGGATCATTATPVGAASIAATYSGTLNYTASTSPDFTQTVSQAATETSLSSGANPSSYTESVTFAATVASTAGLPNGTVRFRAGTTDIVGCEAKPLSLGVTVCTTADLSPGTSSITASYLGSTNFATSASTGLGQVVNPAATTIAVASSNDPSVFSESIVLTATATATPPATGVPIGNVAFTVDSVAIAGCGAVPLASGIAACTTPAFTVGDRTVVASLSDGPTYAGSTSAPTSQTVNKASTTTVVTSSNANTVFSQTVDLTATVTPVSPATATPTGVVSFFDGVTAISGCSSLPLAAGAATCSTTGLAVGLRTITATYATSASFLASTSPSFVQTVGFATSQTAISVDPDPTVSGESVTITASVTPTAPAISIPNGTVAFKAGATDIAECSARPVTLAIATCTTSALAIGGPAITAVYSGSASFTQSTSPGFTPTVAKAATTTVVTSSDASSTWTQPVTFTATISTTAPGTTTAELGTVTFSANSIAISTCTSLALSAPGIANCTVSNLPVATTGITATYNGDATHDASVAPNFNQTVARAASATGIASSNLTTRWGESVTFTATATGVAPASATPTGTVTFSADGGPITGCTALTMSAGVATCSTAALPVGSADVDAEYNGSVNYEADASTDIVQVVSKSATTTGLTSSANPSVVSGPVTFTATVLPTAPGAGVVNGSVAFKAAGALITGCSAKTLTAGSATCMTSALPAGANSITVEYAATTNFLASTSPTATQTVNRSVTVTALSSNHNPSRFGQAVTFTATMTSAGGTPTGSVEFFVVRKDATLKSIAVRPLSAGVAAMTTDQLPVRIGAIVAQYEGTPSFAPSDTTMEQTVSRAGSGITLKSSATPSKVGQTVVFTATAWTSGDGHGTPEGLVALYRERSNGSLQWIGRATLKGGVATITVLDEPLGVHHIIAEYRGDTHHRPSTRQGTQRVNRA